METYKLKFYTGSTFNDENAVFHDSGIPIELAEAFKLLKEKLYEVSNGVYDCSPFVFNPEIKGISTGIFETKNGQMTKLPFYLIIKER